MLQVMHGGASARPFVTHSNAFDTELYLRIAPELYLKRAVVGGIERVFEINRNFRNEGADSTHSPEFAMLEAYEAYGDYTTMADLTQQLIQDAAIADERLARRDLGRRHRVRPRRRVGAHLDVRDALRRGRRADHRRDPDRAPQAARRRRGHRDRPPAARQVRRGALGAPREGRPRAADVRHGLPARHLARSCARTASMPGVVEKWDLYVRGFELATGLLRARRPGRAARALRRAGEARRGRRPRGDAPRRGVPARPRVRHAARRAAWAWASTACSWRSPASASARRSSSPSSSDHERMRMPQ